jgi:hypothetical protein
MTALEIPYPGTKYEFAAMLERIEYCERKWSQKEAVEVKTELCGLA